MKAKFFPGRQLLLAGTLFVLLNTTLANATTIEFRPQTLVAGPGETIALDIYATELDGEIVSAYDFDITYDSLILSAIGVTFATALGDAFFFEVLEAVDVSVPGLVDLAQLSLLPDDLLFAIQGGSEVLLATVLFDTLAAGTSSLDFVFDAFNDVKGFDAAILPIEDTPGMVTVQAPIAVAEPPTWALLLAGLILLTGSARCGRARGSQR